jgi:phosphate-selective porin OprO/OprP
MSNTKTAFRAALIAGVSLLATAGVASAQTAPPASPDEAAARIAALEAQLSALQQQVADLKAATAASFKDVRTVQSATTVSIAGAKPTIASGDGAYSATLHGVMQLDAAQYYQDKGLPAVLGNARDLNNGTNFRRARLGVDGKFAKNFDYSILLDFGGAGTDGAGQLQELFVQYNYAPFKIRVGAYAPNLGLEDAASTNGSLFPERPSSAEAARGLAGADRRIALQGQVVQERWILSGAVTGAKAGDGQTFDEQIGYVGRFAFVPLKGYDWLVHAGVNASVVATPAQSTALTGAYAVTIQDRPELRVDGQQLVTTGAIDAKGARHYGLELAAQKQNFLIQSEYFDYKIDRRNPAAGVSDPKFKGWYVEGGWVLTGEARRYNANNFAFDAPAINNPFDPKAHKWGAWELAGSYSVLDLNHHENATLAGDRVRGGEQTIWTVGLNWFPNSVTKFSVDYLDVDVDRQDPAGGLLPLSQSYQAVNFRSQFAF